MASSSSSNIASYRVLVVDDDPLVLSVLVEFLEAKGYDTGACSTRRRAEEMLRSGAFDATILDYDLPDGNALDILQWMKTSETDVPAVILTGNATIDLAVRTIQQGAEQFLTKPVELAALDIVLTRILENRRNRRRQEIQRSRDGARLDPFIGRSKVIGELFEVASKLALSDSPIQIRGETGIGKGVLAGWVHEHGPRSEEPFVNINCAGLSPEFLDSELFGHQRGAFTGAATSKTGLLEVGHRGTIFLDEIGDVDLRVQPKLLKVLEEKRFRRMGEVREREVNIRLIAASHQDLRSLTKEGRFREDLYFRISTLPLVIPPLRDRPEDIRPLAEAILKLLCDERGRATVGLTDSGAAALEGYRWPGNIREMRNVLERALLLSGSGDALGAEDLHFEPGSPMTAPAAAAVHSSQPSVAEPEDDLTLQDVERIHIRRVLKRYDFNMSHAARSLGISRTTLYQKLKTHEIERP